MADEEQKSTFPFPVGEKPSLLEMVKNNIDAFRGKKKMWEDARIFHVDLPADYDAVDEILPMGMRPAKPPKLRLFVADYTKTTFTGPYNEAAILVDIRTPLEKAVHCPWMVVDDDTALLQGREVAGFPKKMAEIQTKMGDETVEATVERRGTRLVDIDGKRGDGAPIEPVLGRTVYNVGGIGQSYLVNGVWRISVREEIHDSYKAEANVEIGGSEFDAINDFVGDYSNPVDARLSYLDIYSTESVLPAGIAGPNSLKDSYDLRYR